MRPPLDVLMDAVQYAVNRLSYDLRGPQQLQITSDLAAALEYARDHKGKDAYPDTEADGAVYCGKCGQQRSDLA